MSYVLKRNPTKTKKFQITFPDGENVKFGARGYSDYTIHKDPLRMKRYLKRHRSRENWSKGGIRTAGFWARWLLWGHPSLAGARALIEKKFNIKITGSK